MYTPLSCLSMCVNGPQACPQLSASLTPQEWGGVEDPFAAAQGMCVGQGPYVGCQEGPTAGHRELTLTTKPDRAVSLFLCE